MGAFFNFDRKLLGMYFVNDNGTNLFQRNEFDKALSVVKIRFENSSFNETTPMEAPDVNYFKTNTPVVKSWVKDIYAKGSFSAYDVVLQDKLDQKINYKGIEIKKIFSPIDDRIFFVGEHATILDEIGTMEAAVESGERIAKLF